MPGKNPNTNRWGGPGAAHENRDREKPDPLVKDADAPDHLSPRSQVSKGGETDIHSRHGAAGKKKRQGSSEEKRHELDGRRLH